VNQGPGGSTVTLRQCDLKRTVTLNDQAQTYLVVNDPQDEAAVRAAAMVTGAPVQEPAKNGGKIEVTSVISDTGERKQMYGLTARHLKTKVTEKSSADACSKIDQSFEVDGWYADLGKEQAGCTSMAPPVHQSQGCQDAVVERHSGSGKPGYPLAQNVTIHNSDGSTMAVSINVTEVSKKPLDAALFDVPANYKQVNSYADLMSTPQVPQMAQQAGGQPPMGGPAGGGQMGQNGMSPQGMNPQAMAQQMMAQQAMAQYGKTGAMGNMTMGNMAMGMGMTGGNQPASAPVAAPQALGPKAPGKIRIGIAPPDAQLGQGNNAGADYSTPIRNAVVLLMNGPAVEIAALDSHIPMQLQAEAQQKECDYILFSSVAVKHQQGGFGKFAKFGGMAASMTPMGAMAHGVGGAMAAQAAASAASQMAQQQAMNQAMSQLSGFNGQIKSKDDVTVQYSLTQTGQQAPILQNALQGKAKSDGEDVLTPLLQQTANTVLTQVSTKK
ncbi:MAG TPA: hypothetical protein VK466_04460, partial [Terriglobales bacterium]|nr:hypothetical protein [Terriglobales bacterium]